MKSPNSPDSTKYFGVGLQLAITLLFGLLAGYIIDRKFDVLPWGTLCGATLGFIVGFFNLILAVKQNKNE